MARSWIVPNGDGGEETVSIYRRDGGYRIHDYYSDRVMGFVWRDEDCTNEWRYTNERVRDDDSLEGWAASMKDAVEMTVINDHFAKKAKVAANA